MNKLINKLKSLIPKTVIEAGYLAVIVALLLGIMAHQMKQPEAVIFYVLANAIYMGITNTRLREIEEDMWQISLTQQRILSLLIDSKKNEKTN